MQGLERWLSTGCSSTGPRFNTSTHIAAYNCNSSSRESNTLTHAGKTPFSIHKINH